MNLKKANQLLKQAIRTIFVIFYIKYYTSTFEKDKINTGNK